MPRKLGVDAPKSSLRSTERDVSRLGVDKREGNVLDVVARWQGGAEGIMVWSDRVGVCLVTWMSIVRGHVAEVLVPRKSSNPRLFLVVVVVQDSNKPGHVITRLPAISSRLACGVCSGAVDPARSVPVDDERRVDRVRVTAVDFDRDPAPIDHRPIEG